MLSHSFISVCLFFFIGSTVDKNNAVTTKEIQASPTLVYVIGLLLIGNGSFPLSSLWVFEYEMMLTWNAHTPSGSILVLLLVFYCNLSMLSGMIMWLRLKSKGSSTIHALQLMPSVWIGLTIAWMY